MEPLYSAGYQWTCSAYFISQFFSGESYINESTSFTVPEHVQDLVQIKHYQMEKA